MLIGAGTSAKLQIVTSAAADIEVSGSKVVVDQSSPPVVDGTNTGAIILASITTATTTDAVTGRVRIGITVTSETDRKSVV